MSEAMFSVVGHRIPKRDAYDKSTGAARYAGDLQFPGVLHAVVVRSPYSHARIKSLDTREAEAMPGVIKILHHRNAKAAPFTTSEWDAPAALGSMARDQDLFSPIVRHVGEAVAAVAAVDPDTAQAAARAIAVEYESLPVLIDAEEAMRPDAPRVQSSKENNIAAHIQLPFGDPEAGFREADQIIERRFQTSRQKQAPLDPFTCVANYDGHMLTIWSPNQTPHQARIKLADIFGLPSSRVRIINPVFGGGFGARTGLMGEPWAAALAIETKRSVALEYSRYEDFVATEGRHPATIDIKIGFKNDGSLTSLYAKAVVNTGPYSSQGPVVAAIVGLLLQRTYKCPQRYFDGFAVLTNAPVSGAFRGYGGPQAVFALEQVIDEIAERVGKDPLRLRLENVAGPGDPDYLYFRTIENDGMQRCIEEGAKAIDWSNKRGKGGQNGPRRRGVGVAVMTHVSSTACLGEPQTEASVATIRLNADGTCNLITGVTDCGTGPETTLAQVAAEELGVPFESVHVTMGDTNVTPMDLGAHATRTLFMGGLAARAAAQQVKEQAFNLASEMLEARPEDLKAEGGQIWVQGVPSRSVTYGQVAAKAFFKVGEINGRGVAPQNVATPYGAQFAEVEVDVETGHVRVLRLVAAHDVGRSVNPLIVEGQIEGGAVQGIGYALSEDMFVDEDGRPLVSDFLDYKLPTAADVPSVETLVIEAPDPEGPFGAKGVGEPGIIPTAAAIANAIYDAVGVRLTELPMTPARLLAALRAAEAKH